MQAIEAISQLQSIPKICGALVLLDCRQMELEARLSQELKFCQQSLVDVRVIVEPIFDYGCRRDRRCKFGESKCQAISKSSASVHDIIPMATEKNFVE